MSRVVSKPSLWHTHIQNICRDYVWLSVMANLASMKKNSVVIHQTEFSPWNTLIINITSRCHWSIPYYYLAVLRPNLHRLNWRARTTMDTSIPTGERSEQSAGSAANETSSYRQLSSSSSSSTTRQTAFTRPAVRASSKSGKSATRLKLAHQGYFNRKWNMTTTTTTTTWAGRTTNDKERLSWHSCLSLDLLTTTVLRRFHTFR